MFTTVTNYYTLTVLKPQMINNDEAIMKISVRTGFLYCVKARDQNPKPLPEYRAVEHNLSECGVTPCHRSLHFINISTLSLPLQSGRALLVVTTSFPLWKCFLCSLVRLYTSTVLNSLADNPISRHNNNTPQL